MCRMDDRDRERALALKRRRAKELLDGFRQHTGYVPGENNPHLSWLREVRSLTVEQVVAFLNCWYPISRGQPQLLLFCASLFTEQEDRKRLHVNIREEDGYRDGHDPHYDLLGKDLI